MLYPKPGCRYPAACGAQPVCGAHAPLLDSARADATPPGKPIVNK